MELLFAVSEVPLTRLLQQCLLLSQGDTVELLDAWKYFPGMENIPKMSDINGQSKFDLRFEIPHFRYVGKFGLLLHLLIYPLFPPGWFITGLESVQTTSLIQPRNQVSVSAGKTTVNRVTITTDQM